MWWWLLGSILGVLHGASLIFYLGFRYGVGVSKTASRKRIVMLQQQLHELSLKVDPRYRERVGMIDELLDAAKKQANASSYSETEKDP